MRHRSRIVIAGLLAGLCPVEVWAAPVPSPSTPITPATANPTIPAATPEESGPVVAAPPTSETLPEPTPPAATPTPTPYAGAAPPLAPPPGASSPTPYATPGATPPAGVDLGGQSVAPLPPPPASLDPRKISRKPWRGRYWLSFRLGITGPVGGERPAAPTVLSLSGGADFGWRINNVLGLGMGLSGQIHNRLRISERDPLTGELGKRTANGRMLYWDALFVRIYLPLKKRFQPYAEVGGGLARLGRAEGGRSFGAQMRAALGFDGWVSQNVTLGFSATYRLNALNDKEGGNGWVLGHAMQGTFDLGFHW